LPGEELTLLSQLLQEPLLSPLPLLPQPAEFRRKGISYPCFLKNSCKEYITILVKILLKNAK
jgi:hypothetical protein